jgi:hypothetical protein
MLQSAECFMAGFFGLVWTKNVALVLIIEQSYFQQLSSWVFPVQQQQPLPFDWRNKYVGGLGEHLSPEYNQAAKGIVR